MPDRTLDEGEVQGLGAGPRPKDQVDTLPVLAPGRHVPVGMVTRERLATYLGYNRSEIRRRESMGEIRPVGQNGQGWALYRLSDFPDSVRRQTRQQPKARSVIGAVAYTAEEASLVFAELEKGTPLAVIVRDKHVHPEVIEGISRIYAKLTGALFLSAASVEELNKLPFEGTFPLTDEQGLMTMLRNAAAESACVSCLKQPKAICRRCVAARRAPAPG